MQNLLTRLMEIHAGEPDTRRRASVIVRLTLVLLLANIGFAGISLVASHPSSVAIPVASSICFLAAYQFARRGSAAAAAWIMISAFLIGSFVAMASFTTDQAVIVLFFLAAIIVVAGLSTTPAQFWLVVALTLAGAGITLHLAHPDVWQSADAGQIVLSGAALIAAVSGISYLGACIWRQAIEDAQEARIQAEQAQRALAQMNADLEARVAERTTELRQTLAAQQTLAEELQSSLAAQQELSRAIVDLSLPIIPVRDGTVVVPISGSIDSTRAGKLVNSVLQTIERRNVHIVIFDITGVPIVDTQVAQALLQTASAIRLMGAETILAGIRPEVAQTLVGLGIDLRLLRTVATLQEGLELTPRRVRAGALRRARSHVLPVSARSELPGRAA